jgi:predicted nucleic acid-binding protein
MDTNILVYADSPDEPVKLGQTLALLKQLRDAGTGAISTQVLNEYCNVASAQIAGCSVLYSEDMNVGESFAGTRIVNPF